jgi:hypothetical protein
VITWLAEQPDASRDTESQASDREAGTTQPAKDHVHEGEVLQESARLPSSPQSAQQEASLLQPSPEQASNGTSCGKQEHQEAPATDGSTQVSCSTVYQSEQAAITSSSNSSTQTTSNQQTVGSGEAPPGGTPVHKPGLRGTKVKTRPGGQAVRADKPPGRNQPCPCGSKKKYKACCGAAAAAQARRKAAGAGSEDGDGSVDSTIPQQLVTAAQLEAIIL